MAAQKRGKDSLVLIHRWQASVIPSKEQLKLMFQLEGMKFEEELYPAKSEVKDHRHPFDEVRAVVSGELMYNISGNKLLLRPGDRVIVPANTKHSTSVESEEECLSLIGYRIY